jgi:hypothetical protein
MVRSCTLVRSVRTMSSNDNPRELAKTSLWLSMVVVPSCLRGNIRARDWRFLLPRIISGIRTGYNISSMSGPVA